MRGYSITLYEIKPEPVYVTYMSVYPLLDPFQKFVGISVVYGLTHWHTQPAVRRSEPSMSFAFNSSLLSVDGMTFLLPFES